MLCTGDVEHLDFIFFSHSLSFFLCHSICFCFFFLTSDVHQPLSQIRINLASSLGAGQVIFLAGINATENMVREFSTFAESHLLQFSHHGDFCIPQEQLNFVLTCLHPPSLLFPFTQKSKVTSEKLRQSLDVMRNACLICT